MRANIELARLRNHQSRWRTALVDSLQEAFFVCDEHGAVVEINTAFTEILGYGPEDLPYPAVHPWWPDVETDPDAYRLVETAFARMLSETHGAFTVPVTHRDGHRVWVAVNFNHADDPDSGRRVMVGTFRDVTAEHYAVQRQTALAALNQQLAQADTVDDALRGAAEELRRVWQARRVAGRRRSPATTRCRRAGPGLRGRARRVGRTVTASAAADRVVARRRPADRRQPRNQVRRASPCSIPADVLVVWVELAEHRPFTAEDHTLLTVLAGRLGQGLHRVYQVDEQRETAVALQHAMLGPGESARRLRGAVPPREPAAAGRRRLV